MRRSNGGAAGGGLGPWPIGVAQDAIRDSCWVLRKVLTSKFKRKRLVRISSDAVFRVSAVFYLPYVWKRQNREEKKKKIKSRTFIVYCNLLSVPSFDVL